MAEGQRLSARIVALPSPWMRAACAVHAREQELRRFLGEMQRECDALVVRMQLLGYGGRRDGLLARAVYLRDSLAIEARRAPLLQRWEKTFEALERPSAAVDPEVDDGLADEIAACRPSDEPEPTPQLPLTLGGAGRGRGES